jgi:hypothetical protein
LPSADVGIVRAVDDADTAKYQARFHYHILDAGIGHVYIKLATPRLNGRVGR